jgi:hypothetical protein
MKSVEKLSPIYAGVDSELTIGFGGLVVYWKPQCIIYLIQFLNSQTNGNSKKEAKESFIHHDSSIVIADERDYEGI